MAERLGDFSYLPGEGVAGQTYATGVPQYVPDLNRAPDLPRRDEIRAVLAVPLMSPAAAPLGVLSVASLRPEAFTPHQQRLLETVAGQAAIAVQNARLYEAAEQQHRRQVALAEVELAINQAHELQAVLDRIAQVTTELLPASGGASVLLWDPQAAAFFASSSTVPGQVPETDAQSALYQGGATRWIVNHCQPLVVTDARDDHSGANPMLSEFGARAFAGVPLLAERAALGVLYALDQHPREYTQEDLDFLAALTSRAAFAVTKVLLSESLQRVIEQARLDALANEVLLKEIHHRVKNNLQIVAGLLDLQSDYVRDEQSLQMLQESQSWVKAMGLVHEKLYRDRGFETVDCADYVQSLAEDVFRLYRGHAAGVTFKANAEGAFLGVDTAVPCGLITHELISNALKHAFPGGGGGEIYLALLSDNDEITLVVRDNGVGFPKDLDFRNPESLGLKLVLTLVRQLKAPSNFAPMAERNSR